jgi:hypothetical protein
MDLTEPAPQPEVSKQSAEYRLRFRYQLWSQAAQDFRSRAAAPQRFASTRGNGAAVDLNSRTAERRDALNSETMPATDGAG